MNKKSVTSARGHSFYALMNTTALIAIFHSWLLWSRMWLNIELMKIMHEYQTTTKRIISATRMKTSFHACRQASTPMHK